MKHRSVELVDHAGGRRWRIATHRDPVARLAVTQATFRNGTLIEHRERTVLSGDMADADPIIRQFLIDALDDIIDVDGVYDAAVNRAGIW